MLDTVYLLIYSVPTEMDANFFSGDDAVGLRRIVGDGRRRRHTPTPATLDKHIEQHLVVIWKFIGVAGGAGRFPTSADVVGR